MHQEDLLLINKRLRLMMKLSWLGMFVGFLLGFLTHIILEMCVN